MFSFGSPAKAEPKKDTKTQAREMQRSLRKEQRAIDRQMRAIERQENTTLRDCKKLVKAGNTSQAKLLAKGIAQARKQRTRMENNKAHLKSVELQIGNMAAMSRTAAIFGKSTEIMKSMSKLVKAPEIGATMREMSAEMAKMGIIEEVMDDAMEVMEDEDLEDEADEEVDKILFDITSGMASASTSAVPGAVAATTAAPTAAPARRAVMEGMDTMPAAPGPAPGGSGGDGSGGAGGAVTTDAGSAAADDLMARLAGLRS